MKKQLFKACLAAFLLFLAKESRAQAPGSESVYGGSASPKTIAGGTSADASETLYIGAGTHTIDGVWEIYSKNVVIDPAAVFSGTGTIMFFNPSLAGGAASATLIDGNAGASSASIDVNVELSNDAGMQLSNIPFPSDLITDGWLDNSLVSTLYLGKDLSLTVDGADITLGTGVVGDLRFDNDATISNYRPSRMVIVSNSILSHMVKESYTGAFTFPIGIADGDYTPAQVSNVSAVTVSASVQDYAASASPEGISDPGPGGIPADGINRTWHIFGSAAGSGSTITLQHNSITNQSGFSDANYYVTQWGTTIPNTTGDYTVGFGGTPWQTNTSAAGSSGSLSSIGAIAGSTMRGRAYSALATGFSAEESYFSASSDPFHPLPVKLISFTAAAQQCNVQLNWETGVETGVSSYKLKHSTDGVNYTTIATLFPNGSSNYSYLHQAAAKGTNLYRLEMVEKDGSYQVSEVLKVDVSCGPQFLPDMKLFPNPTSGTLTVSGMGSGNSSQIRVLNLHGQIVQSIPSVKDSETFSIADLPQASYLVQVLQYGKIVLTEKVSKL